MIAATATGCSDSKLAVPSKFCEVPVHEASLSPLLPESGSLEQTRKEFRSSRTGGTCFIKVDDRVILNVIFELAEGAPQDQFDWKQFEAHYKHAAKRDVAFPGEAVIGADGAVVHAMCDKQSAYMSFVFYFRGDRVDNTPNGYRKLQRFIEDFVPLETSRYRCT